MIPNRNLLLRYLVASAALISACFAQECYSGSEIDPSSSAAVSSTAQQIYNFSARGDVAGLRSLAAPEIAGNFGPIEKAVISHESIFAQGAPSETRAFVLDATNSSSTWQRAEFYCGIYNSPNRIGIAIPNLPPGRYALTIARVSGKEPGTLTLILKDTGRNTWKLAGYYARAGSLGGHEGAWYTTKAREYKEKGQAHNAWFYYLTAWDLLAPVDFVSTPTLDRLSDELQAARPGDLPSSAAPLMLTANGKTYKVIDLSALPINNELYVRAQYESANTNNAQIASQENASVMKALLAKYPEFKDAFGGVVALATDNAGHDYGTVTPMKDIK